MGRSEALKRAQEVYDSKRPRPLVIRLNHFEYKALIKEQSGEESPNQAAKRVLLTALGVD